MQVIIEIPESEIPKRQDIIEIPLHFIDGKVCEAGGYGFDVLPKGHGGLIDADELRLDVIAHKYSNSFCDEHNIDHSINVGMLNILIADAPTIIEADKEE